MNGRFLFTMTLAGCAAAVVGAQGPTPRPTAAEQARLLQRNHDLVRVLVDEGLELSSRSEPLGRAESCGRVAAKLAAELGQAARNRESARVVELGQHLDTLLDKGLVPNLRAARGKIPADTSSETHLFEVRDQTMKSLDPITEATSLGEFNKDVRQVLGRLAESRKAVENAVPRPQADKPR